MVKNWLHLDLKGAVPSADIFRDWLKFFRRCGFAKILFECDCRLPWECWRHAVRPRFSKDEFRDILQYAKRLGFETAPLIQSIGHLEWALRHEEYAVLRENNRINELCPHYPDSLDKILQWVREAVELFPESQYIHLGADETWSLGSCPKCREAAQGVPELGPLGGYAEHVGKVCAFADSLGRRPLIWGDMLSRPAGANLLARLPDCVIPVIWRYYGDQIPVWDNAVREQWGASGIQCSWNNYPFEAMNNPLNRIENVLGWNSSGQTVIHTVWGRPDNLRCLYPPWYASVGVFIAAGNPQIWSTHPWRAFFERINTAFRRGFPGEAADLADAALTLPVEDVIEQGGKRYLSLALRYWALRQRHLQYFFGSRALETAELFIGSRDRNAHHCNYPSIVEALQLDLDNWGADMEKFWESNQLSDKEEFIAEKKAAFVFS